MTNFVGFKTVPTTTEISVTKTYRVAKYHVYENRWEAVILPRNAGFEFVQSLGKKVHNHLLVVDATIPEDRSGQDEKVQAAESRLYALKCWGFGECHAPAPKGFDTSGFIMCTAGSSQMRESAFYMSRGKELRNQIWDYAFCGFSPIGEKFAVNKALAYSALLFSASKPMKEVYGFDFDICKVVVVPDLFMTKAVRADVVRPDGSDVDLDVERKLRLAFNDGQACYEAGVFKARASKEVYKKLRGVAPTFTNRASTGAIKWACVPVWFRAFFAMLGITHITDIWGVKHPIDEIEVLAAESTFKQKGLLKSGDDWLRFCKEFQKRNGHFRVCIAEHGPKPSRMGYQFMQTLVAASDDDIDYMANVAKEALDQYKDPAKAALLLGGNAAKVAQAYPALLKLRWCKNTMDAAYESRRNQALGGSMPKSGSYAFAAGDPIACLEGYAGLPIRGCLKDGECLCFAADAGEVDICRSPQLDHSHVVLQNVRNKASRFLVQGPTMYFNVHDETTIRLRMDYDGDHVWWCSDKRLIDLVKRTNRLINMRVTDWDAPESQKSNFSWTLMEAFLGRNTKGSLIGTYADNSTRVWAAYPELVKNPLVGEDGFRKAVAWLTWAGNVLIDAAKHGSVKVAMPTFVENALYPYVELATISVDSREVVDTKSFKTAEQARKEKKTAAVPEGCYMLIRTIKRPLPAFCEFAKADSECPIGDERWREKTALTNGVGDRYMQKVQELTAPELRVEGLDDLNYDQHDFMFDPNRKQTAGIFNGGKYNHYTNKWENQGLFNEIAFARRAELKTASIDKERVSDWMFDKDEYLRYQIEGFCYEQKISLEAAYDVIVRDALKYSDDPKKDGRNNVIYRTLFSAYGDFFLRALEYRGFAANGRPVVEEAAEEEAAEIVAEYTCVIEEENSNN